MIRVICLGKIKESYLSELISDYGKRINKYHKLEIIELKDEENILKEEESVLKYINSKDYVVTLEIDGKELNSKDLAELIDKTFVSYSNIVFVIGSSLGLGARVKERSNFRLSFSKLTFPHGLFRGILLEQVYRAFKIMNNENYHK